jgi:cell wall-associated NlpC family hydrolase
MGLTSTLLGLGIAAYADDTSPVPTTQQLADARADVQRKQQGVAAMQAELAAAQASLASAQTAASIASEEYNGAMWRLSESRKASRQAKARATELQDRVRIQRDGMARLVVQSYQEGTQINAMTAILDADGPTAIMGRQAVVDMARDTLEADLQQFRELSAEAKKAEASARKAAAEQQELAASARSARDAAMAAVGSAAAIEREISTQRDALVAELARSENISLDLARQRQEAVEAQAAAEFTAAQREQAAAAAKADRDRETSAAPSAPSTPSEPDQPAEPRPEPEPEPRPADPRPEPADPPPPPPAPEPPAPSGGVKAALDFARAQIGEPYRWGAAGPNSWDCSGLTMKAWARGGKSLPHYSVAQYSEGTRIPISSARPGDLYFWSSNGRPSGIHHVAIATGDGDFIEAPRTGLDVRYNHISNWFPTFAVRL